MSRFAIILLIASFPPFSNGQEIKLTERITAIAEELAADENDPGAADLFSDWLYDLSENKVMINSGDEKEISRLFFLTDFQVKILAEYVKTSGSITSPFEIANIPGFDRETTETLIPFITLEAALRTKNNPTRLRQIFLTNLIFNTAQEDTSFVGSPWKNLIKYKFTISSFSGGLTAEKDPGEKFFYGKPPSPDFLSGHLTYEGHNIIKQIIIGDYSVCYGQGTSINTGIRTGLSLTSPGYLAGRNEIRPYTSADENNYFRGIATELSYKNASLSLFLSKKKIDATINDKSDSAISTIKIFYKTGFHNTKGSLLKKDVASETCLGINLSYNFNNLRAGVIWTENIFSLPVLPDQSNPTDRLDFAGRTNSLISVYYNGLFKRFIFFGEFSASGVNKYALTQGVSIMPADRININLIYSFYSPYFESFHGNGLSGNTANKNEQCILGNFTFEAARFLFISAGTDMRNFPWLRYRCSAPSQARKHEIRIKYLPTQKLILEAIYNYRFSIVDNKSENTIPGQDEIMVKSIRGNIKFSPTEYCTIIIRADYKLVNPSESKGMLLLQDINLRFRKLPVSIWMRYSIFNTSSYDSGLYTWENDLSNSFSIPVLSGDGNRAYIMASFKIADKIQLRLKYGITTKAVINDRMDEVHEYKIQIRITI
jgi:hypothetical protein